MSGVAMGAAAGTGAWGWAATVAIEGAGRCGATEVKLVTSAGGGANAPVIPIGAAVPAADCAAFSGVVKGAAISAAVIKRTGAAF